MRYEVNETPLPSLKNLGCLGLCVYICESVLLQLWLHVLGFFGIRGVLPPLVAFVKGVSTPECFVTATELRPFVDNRCRLLGPHKSARHIACNGQSGATTLHRTESACGQDHARNAENLTS